MGRPRQDEEQRHFHREHRARSQPVQVDVRGLTKSFGAVQAVVDLSFTVEPGSVTGFLGPNGAGKTTTLRMLLGLVRPTSGGATINGLPFDGWAIPSTVSARCWRRSFHPTVRPRAPERYAAAAGLPD